MNNKVVKGLQLILVLVLVFSLGKIGLYYKDQHVYDRNEARIEEKYRASEKAAAEDAEKDDADDAHKAAAEKIAALKKDYPDLVAWIEIPGTPLSLPVVQGKDNDYYLNHDIEKSRNALGVPFMDYRNKADFSDQNTIIYGHRVKNGKVFHPLLSYEDPEFVKTAPKIVVDTEQGRKVYEIFAAYKANPYEDFRSVQYEGKRLAAFRTRLETKNILKGPLNWQEEKIITLQTCSEKEERMVIHGRLVEEK